MMGFSLSCLPLRAQSSGTQEAGFKPYGAFNYADIDSVNLANKKLELHIPLFSYPQRGGKLTVGFTIRYHVPTFSYSTSCPPKVACSYYYNMDQQPTAYVTMDGAMPGISWISVTDSPLTDWANIQPLLPRTVRSTRRRRAARFIELSTRVVITTVPRQHHVAASITQWIRSSPQTGSNTPIPKMQAAITHGQQLIRTAIKCRFKLTRITTR